MEANRDIKISLSCAALLFPATFFVGKAVEYILKSTNPSHVNITSELAYLAPILYIGMATFAIILLVGLVSGLRALKGQSKSLAQLSLTLLTIEVILTGVALILQQASKGLS